MDKLDKKDFNARIQLLKPANMFAIFMSPLLKSEFETNPDKIKVERFYKKEFTIEHVSDDEAKRWEEAVFKPTDSAHGLLLGYPPSNKYMPCLDNLKPQKAEREDPKKSNVPK